ncbi:MAG: hypothetical protein Unbinned5350contig1004_10 [Prokaryotic dsDNA virus sp.]|nr:MAG: hypothetical protein Unbinned5350contig1004_10 [Prokaryotic dsDNA virus sp.]|tara:strand:- start:25915 stop:26286 length:372 start_codon:yes stop_codon:yes gene_type:complete
MKQANAAQKKWMSDITKFIEEESLGILYPDYEGRFEMQRHHVMGRSARHNKVDIGHWFIIPVPFELHDPNINHEFHVGSNKKSFVKKYGDQRGIFQSLISCMAQWGYDVPPMDVYHAIMDTRA